MTIGSLGYVGFSVKDPEAWSAFATGVLGLMPGEPAGGAQRYRLDDLAWRIAVEPGEADDLAYVGFEVAGPTELEAVRERLTAAGPRPSRPMNAVCAHARAPTHCENRSHSTAISAIAQALGVELVFAATGYRSWGWRTMAAAGVAAALVALPWNWLRLGYFALDPEFLLVLVGVRVASGAAAGLLGKTIADLIAGSGSLNAFAISRERVREV